MQRKPNLAEVNAAIPEAELLKEIGSGGFKIVYKASISNQTEAIKLVYLPKDENDETVLEENRRRVFRELDILAKCDSPYIVKLGSIEPRPLEIQSNSYVLYSEEFLPGDSLQQLLGSGHRPAKEEILELLACMLGAVQNLMQFRVIHRDIKPGNIIKTTLSDRPFVLLDLGLAFAVGGSRITRDSQKIPGTLYYIAPEMLEMNFRQNLDFRADLYTIGLTIYEYASGINPYARRQEDQFTTLYRIKNYKPKPLNQLRTDLPTDMCNLIDQLMRKIPALRPANIDQLLKRQEAF